MKACPGSQKVPGKWGYLCVDDHCDPPGVFTLNKPSGARPTPHPAAASPLASGVSGIVFILWGHLWGRKKCLPLAQESRWMDVTFSRGASVAEHAQQGCANLSPAWSVGTPGCPSLSGEATRQGLHCTGCTGLRRCICSHGVLHFGFFLSLTKDHISGKRLFLMMHTISKGQPVPL